MPNWIVYLSSTTIGWIRSVTNENPDRFDNYEKAISAVRRIAKEYSENDVVLCGVGFLIKVPNEDNTYLECGIDEKRNRIYIVRPL